jgi:hypothetical protein
MADLSEIVQKERQNMVDAPQKRGLWYFGSERKRCGGN